MSNAFSYYEVLKKEKVEVEEIEESVDAFSVWEISLSLRPRGRCSRTETQRKEVPSWSSNDIYLPRRKDLCPTSLLGEGVLVAGEMIALKVLETQSLPVR